MIMLSIGKATASLGQLVKSPEVIAIASASLLTPFLQPMIDGLIAKIPFLRDHRTVALIVIAVIVFMIAAKAKAGGVIRAIIIGVAGSMFLLAVIPVVQQVVRK